MPLAQKSGRAARRQFDSLRDLELADADRIDDLKRTVAVFAEAERAGELIAIVTSLGFLAVDGWGGVPEVPFLASLVCGTVDPDLAISKAMQARSFVIGVGRDTGFDSRIAASNAGVRAIVEDPIDPVELSAWLAECEAALRDCTPHKVLIVDDDAVAAGVYALALEAHGIEARVLSDPRRILEEIRDAVPDLLLLDMHMPGVDGLSVARVLRQSRQAIALPILFLSAEQDADLQREARSIGGDDFILKPIDPFQLASIVRIRADRAAALRMIMERDGLTGLLNHARFKERLEAEIERSERSATPLTTCILDIDHFKSVNDTHGHQIGDRVIQTLSRCLVSSLRRTDVVARYGGEEFALILIDTPPERAAAVIDRIRSQFAEVTMSAHDAQFSVTFSAGVAGWQKGIGADMLLGEADKALYRAKRSGRNRICTAD